MFLVFKMRPGKGTMAAIRGMGPKETTKFVRTYAGRHAGGGCGVAGDAVTVSLWAAALGVSAIGAGLALAQGTMRKHGVKQVDRLPSNAKLDVWEFFGRWVPHVIGARKKVVVSLD